ncbi:hypothetical protein HanXRQr2_Chr01g0038811 [Helianthus annuus]|uniref:Uncharacterized protein n=1 Tax=Helianthus annuus TaxID=4232 RepID=A0A9K3JY29_HELAN|nr:hypothetical protein HanXRQr2_Chr01g0038811 [Helianthus annuus]KAJ0612817.1 hypothetical protein HanHA300_Chr01g0031561 [Helianthus annuus]KAJ0628203.1 hypothetical protein HanHA89_Chr01g0034101 [Helianthus annuus]KAJ0784492.1 hypothetical protein HanLR1_Chr01g0032611 [Helianthus annuus]
MRFTNLHSHKRYLSEAFSYLTTSWCMLFILAEEKLIMRYWIISKFMVLLKLGVWCKARNDRWELGYRVWS